MPDVPNRRNRQADFARDLARLGQEHRRELETLLGDPPDIRHVPSGFWQRVERDTDERIAEHLLLIFLLTAVRVGISRQSGDALAAAYARSKAIDSAKRHVDFVKDRIERASRIWRDRAESGLPITQADIRDKTLPTLGPTRSDVVATTLTTEASTAGTRAAVADINEQPPEEGKPPKPKVKLMWKLGPCKHCTFCPLVAGTDEDYYSQFIGGPPAHINCCCSTILVPATFRTKTPNTAEVNLAARGSNVFGI